MFSIEKFSIFFVKIFQFKCYDFSLYLASEECTRVHETICNAKKKYKFNTYVSLSILYIYSFRYIEKIIERTILE